MFRDHESNCFYIFITCLAFGCHAVSQSLNRRLEITRGDKDQFTNPVCTKQGSFNCSSFGAHCIDKTCLTCQCNRNTTFNPAGSCGKCEMNDKFGVSVGKFIKSSS